MSTLFQKLYRALDENIGRCPRCMRMCFVAAVGTAGVAVVINILTADAAIARLVWLPALACAALWTLHLGVFAARTVGAAAVRQPGVVSNLAATQIAPQILPRRRFFSVFGKAFIFGAIATALGSSAALACVQPPVPCSSNGDCSCSGCCAGSHCQPSC